MSKDIFEIINPTNTLGVCRPLAHILGACLVDNSNKYPVIGGSKLRSTAKVMILSVPADTGLTVEGVLSVLNANASGYSYWERSDSINGGYPYPKKIDFESLTAERK